MTDRSGPGLGEPESGTEQRHISPAAEAAGVVPPKAMRRPANRPDASEAADRAPLDRRQQRRWVPLTASWIGRLVGLAFVVVGLNAELYRQVHVHIHSRLHRVAAGTPGALALTSSLTRTALVVIGVLLLMLCHGLRRRKHRSWQAVMALLIIAAVVNLVRLHHHASSSDITAVLVGFGITSVLIGFGWAYQEEFYAVGDPRTRWRALGALVVLGAADIAIGLAFIAMRGLVTTYTFPERLQAILYGLFGASPPVPLRFVPELRVDAFGILTGTLGILTLVVTLYLFLRPAGQVERLGASDQARVRSLLDRYGDADSLGYFALRADKNIIWSPTGKSCIGYRVLNGVMLASGDPLGDPEAWPGAIHAFLDEASRHAWAPAVLGSSELGAEVWCRCGDLTALELGDEAVVEVAGFSLQGRPMRNVRQMVTRVSRAGYVAQVRRVADVPAAELARLARQSDSWRGNPTERGFSMALGRIGGPGDGRCVIATATSDGVLRALLQFVPWGADGLSLDLMRRDRSAQPGLNDFLIVEAIKAAPDLGVKRISLNFAAFRATLERGERIGAGPVVRATRRVLLWLSRWFQIESLYKFNAKFCPEWVPRFMVFPSPRDAVRIGLSALEAEALLVWPTIELRRIGRKLRDMLRPRQPRAGESAAR